MHRHVLPRHGECARNRENRLTGWTDADLPRTQPSKDTAPRCLPSWHDAIGPRRPDRAARAHRRARKQPSAAGEAPRRHQRRLHRGVEHPGRRPPLYELDDDLLPLRHDCSGDPEQVRLAGEAVARQGKATIADQR